MDRSVKLFSSLLLGAVALQGATAFYSANVSKTTLTTGSAVSSAPYKAPNGAFYSPIEDSATSFSTHMYKSTDQKTWAEQNSGSAPATFLDQGVWSGTLFIGLYWDGSHEDIIKFDTATDTWGSPINDSGSTLPRNPYFEAVLSSGHIIAFYNDNSTGHLMYSEHAGSTWGAPVQIPVADAGTIAEMRAIAVDPSDGVSMIYGQDGGSFATNTYYRRLLAGSMSSEVDMDALLPNSHFPNLGGYGLSSVINGNVYMPYNNNSNLNLMVLVGTSFASPTWSEQVVNNYSLNANIPVVGVTSVYSDGTYPVVTWATGTSSFTITKIYQSQNVAGAWSTPALLIDSAITHPPATAPGGGVYLIQAWAAARYGMLGTISTGTPGGAFSVVTSITTAIESIETTPSQALITTYTNTGAANCTYRASLGTTLDPANLVIDVDTAFYAGSNSDARAGSIISNYMHYFVLGTNAAQASDGLSPGIYFSRALQTATNYTVGVTCSPDLEVTQTFTTSNQKWGDQKPISPIFDLTRFGNVQVPNIFWGTAWRDTQATNTKFNSSTDPLTGTLLKRATDAADVGFSTGTTSFNLARDTSGHWANPNNALSGSSGSLTTCDTAAGCLTTNKLFLAAPITFATTNFSNNAGWTAGATFNDMLAMLWGSGTSGVDGNRTVNVCWSTDGQTCATASISVILPLTTAAFAGTAPPSWSNRAPWNSSGLTNLTTLDVSSGTARVVFNGTTPTLGSLCINGVRNQITTGVGGNGLNGCHGVTGHIGSGQLFFDSNAANGSYASGETMLSSTYPSNTWGSWATAPLHSLIGQVSGASVTCLAGVCTIASPGPTGYANQDWVAGTPIKITGSSATVCSANDLCTIASVTDYAHFTLNQALNITAAAWTSANFGLLINKTTSTGAVSLSSAWELAYSTSYSSGLDGSGDVCNQNPVTVSVDVSGNAISPSKTGYLCVMNNYGISQATTPIYLFIPSNGETRLITRIYKPSVGDYRQWIGWDGSQGNVFYACYTPNCNPIDKVTYNGDYRGYYPGFNLSAVEPPVIDLLTFSDIFAGSSISSQISNCFVNSKCSTPIASIFGTSPSPPQQGAAIKGSILVMSGSAGSQDTPGYITYWDTSTIPANLLWAGYTFDKFPVGYAGIHAVIQFGDGQHNGVQLNMDVGQNSSANFNGPWRITPTMLDKGSGYTSNTAVTPSDGYYCPAGLDAKWQAIGAKPLVSGGLPLCLKFKIPGTPCSNAASAAEAAAFPCPWAPSDPTKSSIKLIGEGDTIHDLTAGFVSFGEFMLVVQVAVNSTSDIDVLVFRYRLAPLAFFNCGSGTGAEMTHANGWTWTMAPYLACPGDVYWTNTADPTRGWQAETQTLEAIHADFGPGKTDYTFAGGASLNGYQSRSNLPISTQIGQQPNSTGLADPKNGSVNLPDVFLQTYPSKRQQPSLTPTQELNWALDVRSYNPSFGNGPETGETLFGNTISLVGGRTNTYLITFPSNQTPDPKHVGFVSWSGYHMLADKSGPGSSLLDADLWKFCYAYLANECITGSSAGNMYVSVPEAPVFQQCLVNAYAYNAPCISNLYPAGWMTTQYNTAALDPLGYSLRRITGALVAPGRQYNFTNSKTPAFAGWALVQPNWLEGQRTDMFWAKLPDVAPISSHAGFDSFSNFFTIPMKGVSGDTFRVKFGYNTSFQCTSRLEVCWTASTSTVTNPFLYDSETASYVSCSTTCTINIPAQSGRVMYYAIQRKNGSTVTTGPTRIKAIP